MEHGQSVLQRRRRPDPGSPGLFASRPLQGVTYNVFYGYTQSWVPKYGQSTSMVTLNCYDALALLNLAMMDMSLFYPAQVIADGATAYWECQESQARRPSPTRRATATRRRSVAMGSSQPRPERAVADQSVVFVTLSGRASLYRVFAVFHISPLCDLGHVRGLVPHQRQPARVVPVPTGTVAGTSSASFAGDRRLGASCALHRLTFSMTRLQCPRIQGSYPSSNNPFTIMW